MSRIYADFLPLESSDTAKNYGLLPPVVKVLLSIPNDIEFLVSRTDKEEVTEIRKAFQVAVSEYIRKARELVRHYRTDRSAGIMSFTARNTRLGPGVNLTYVSNYGVEYITIRIGGDEAREIIKKIKEDEESLCLLVMHSNNRVTAISMKDLATGRFKVVYRKTLARSNWRSTVSAQTARGISHLPTFQLRLGSNTHVVAIGGVTVEGNVITASGTNGAMFNAPNGFSRSVVLSRPTASRIGQVGYNGSASRIFSLKETIAVSDKGDLSLADYSSQIYDDAEVSIDSAGRRYVGEAGGLFGGVTVGFTPTQDQAYLLGGSGFGWLAGPGEADIDVSSISYDGLYTTSGSIQFPIWVHSRANKLDAVEVKWTTASVLRVSNTGDAADNLYQWSGAGFAHSSSGPDFTYIDLQATVDAALPHYGTQKGVGIYATEINFTFPNTYQSTVYTPHESKAYPGSVGANTRIYLTGWMHVSNGVSTIQAAYSAGPTSVIDHFIYLNGADIKAQLINVVGPINTINAMAMDIKLSDIKKLK